jgi:hypothetical protein
MKTTFVLAAASIILSAAGAGAQDAKKTDSTDKPRESVTQGIAEKKASTEELEAKFKATLTKATFSGRWCSIKDGQIGPEKEDKYTITGVVKLTGDVWLIKARIQYGKTDVVAPIPVQVKWAGDTPVIIVDKVPVPGSGTYSARVLIYEKTYAGSWSGGDHGGLLNGTITNEKE